MLYFIRCHEALIYNMKGRQMKIKQIIPATDWYFKHDETVWHVAAFALTEDDAIIGLVGAGDDGTLKTVPTRVKGSYLNRLQLSEAEIEAADKKR